MNTKENIQKFLTAANISSLSRALEINRRDLTKMRDGDFRCQFHHVEAVSKYMDNLVSVTSKNNG